AVVVAGLAIWWFRGSFATLQKSLAWLETAATKGFGFEWLNGRIVTITQGMGIRLQSTQTGQLGWNLVGIILGVLLVAVILLGGS
ncbi:MAG: hypothetical protein DWQ04_32710, partial [Chloroflexi bacterium]